MLLSEDDFEIWHDVFEMETGIFDADTINYDVQQIQCQQNTCDEFIVAYAVRNSLLPSHPECHRDDE